jgi:hypothetical protein
MTRIWPEEIYKVTQYNPQRKGLTPKLWNTKCDKIIITQIDYDYIDNHQNYV